MQDIFILRKLYDLKTVNRDIPIQDKYESSAEHSRSAMLLADYFIEKLNLQLDRMKVFELLLYHDLTEIETGDISLADTEARKNKKEITHQAMDKVASELPFFMREKYKALYWEMEDNQTLEAKFANAMDKLDAQLQCFNTPEAEIEQMTQAFLPYTEALVRYQKEKYFMDYSDIAEFSEIIIQSWKDRGYLSK